MIHLLVCQIAIPVGFQCRVPDIEPDKLREADRDLLSAVEKGFTTVGDELEAVHLRSAIDEAMKLAKEGNIYLSNNEPWKTLKTSPEEAALAIYTALGVIDSLKVIFAPFLPFTSEKLHGYFGYETPLFGIFQRQISSSDQLWMRKKGPN